MSQQSSAPRTLVDHLIRVDLQDVDLDHVGPQYVGNFLVFAALDHVKLVDNFAPVRVNLTQSPNHFGMQTYFMCPRCRGRARILCRDPKHGTWACQACHRVTWASRTRGKTPHYRLMELHVRELERATVNRRRHPKSAKADARLVQARARCDEACREYMEWARAQVEALAEKLKPRSAS